MHSSNFDIISFQKDINYLQKQLEESCTEIKAASYTVHIIRLCGK